MSEIIAKEQCPLCAEEGKDKAMDNLSVFTSGVKYCVARHGTIGTGAKVDDVKMVTRHEMSQGLSRNFIKGTYVDIKSRGISRKTCEFAKYQVEITTKNHIANYHDVAGNLVMQQIRTPDKEFPILGDRNYSDQLWGMEQYTPNDKLFICITEGQIDRLSILEAFDCKYPVVSLPNGAKAAAKVLTKHKKWLEGFKYVVYAFDNDKDGIAATKECLPILEPGYVRVAKWPQKDANDLLQLGEKSTIREVIYSAVEYIPEPVLTGEKLLDKLIGFNQRSVEWPWKTANKVLSPIMIPGVYTVAGLPSTGKTVVMADLVRYTVDKGLKIGIISLEQSVQRLVVKLTSMITGVDLTNIRNRAITEEERQSCKVVTDSIVTFDHETFGSDLDGIISALPYMSKSLGCEIIIFDNLSYSATSVGDDERRAIDKAMIKIKDCSTRYGFTLINVCHLNDDADEAFKSTMRGSRGIFMYSDYVIYLDRDIESSDEFARNTLNFYVKKDRETGQDTGKSFSLRYNVKKQRLEN